MFSITTKRNFLHTLRKSLGVNIRSISSSKKYLKSKDETQEKPSGSTGKEICVPGRECKIVVAEESSQPGGAKVSPCSASLMKSECDVEPCRPDTLRLDQLAEEVTPPQTIFDANVVIVGAGMAGLSAAHRLIQSGIKNCVILEAGNRPGGRVQSLLIKDVVVELGSDRSSANATNNPLLERGVRDNFLRWPLSKTNPGNGLFNYTEGEELALPIAFKSYLAMKSIMEEYERLLPTVGQKERGAFSNFIGVRAQQEMRRFPPGQTTSAAAKVFVGLACALKQDQGDSKGSLTNDALGSYAQIEGAQVQVPLGYVSELGPLLKTIGAERIKYKKEVQSIRWGTITSTDAPRAIVKCYDGTEFPAHYVIMTCSLGVLKRVCDTMFCPTLPGNKIQAIKSLKYEHVNRVFFQYEKPFWSWREDPINFVPESPKLNGQSGWLSGITELIEISGSDYILSAKIKGKEAALSLEQNSAEEVLEEATDFLKQYLGDKDIPKPCNVYRSTWSGDRHFLGAYSQLDCEENALIKSELSSPLPLTGDTFPPIIYFAGEATCAELSGTVHGAQLSGIREAERLIKIIKEIPKDLSPCHKKEMMAVAG